MTKTRALLWLPGFQIGCNVLVVTESRPHAKWSRDPGKAYRYCSSCTEQAPGKSEQDHVGSQKIAFARRLSVQLLQYLYAFPGSRLHLREGRDSVTTRTLQPIWKPGSHKSARVFVIAAERIVGDRWQSKSLNSQLPLKTRFLNGLRVHQARRRK